MISQIVMTGGTLNGCFSFCYDKSHGTNLFHCMFLLEILQSHLSQ